MAPEAFEEFKYSWQPRPLKRRSMAAQASLSRLDMQARMPRQSPVHVRQLPGQRLPMGTCL